MKCIIDTDPGADDVLALIMALNSPDLDILALTTVEGNARLEHTTANALRLLAYMGHGDIPVYAGSSMPLVGEFHHAYEVHGDEGLTVRLPDTDNTPADGNAVDYIIETAMASPGEITLFALGPLTNVARALRQEPRLKDAVKRVYIMGGQGDGSGNVTPYAEFNIWDDPHAANVVFGSGAPVTLLGLNISRQTSIPRDDESWQNGDTPGERLAAQVLEKWFDLDEAEHRQRFSMHDPVTIMAALRPDLIETRAAAVSVETEGERVGEVAADYERGGSVDVAVAVQSAEALAFMRGLLWG
ncbi:MAG: ribonucleoside hydrolase [Chloroflexi bacterium]|nr:ribonucleoside hydrolase [Chloroflexota bacterium]